MNLEYVHVGQRIRINVPGVDDHGQVGTVKRVRRGQCFIHFIRGAEEMGLPLDEAIADVLSVLKATAPRLGLEGTAAQ